MTRLFRKAGEGAELTPVDEAMFVNEASDLEDFVLANPSLLGEGISIVGRQIDTGNAGRIDLLGLIREPTAEGAGQIVVIELKNTTADTRVLLQSLRYANWTLGNPDSVRLHLTKKGIDVGQVDLHPRIIVAAPIVDKELVELSQYVEAFEFNFVEIRRFRQSGEVFVVATPLVSSIQSPAQVSERQEWNWEKYKTERGWKTESISFGQKLLVQVEARVQKEAWPLSCRFRKNYIAFQLDGTKNVFGIQPAGASGSWWLWFRLPKSPPKKRLENQPYLYHWNPQDRILTLTLDTPKLDTGVTNDFFHNAYKWASGEAGT